MHLPSQRCLITEEDNAVFLPLLLSISWSTYLPFKYRFNTVRSMPMRLQNCRKLSPFLNRSVDLNQESAYRLRNTACSPLSQLIRFATSLVRANLRKDPSRRASNSAFCLDVNDISLLPSLIMVCLPFTGCVFFLGL